MLIARKKGPGNGNVQIAQTKEGRKENEHRLSLTLRPDGTGLLPTKPQGAQGDCTSRGKPVSLLIDTRAAHSVLTEPLGPLTGKRTPIQGATGQTAHYLGTTRKSVHLGKGTVTHSFLVISECPYPLLGWDLLQKLQAVTSFEGKEAHLSVAPQEPKGLRQPLLSPAHLLPTCLMSEEYLLQERNAEPQSPDSTESKYLRHLQEQFPMVWAENNPPGLAGHQPPVVVQLTATATPVPHEPRS